MAGPVPTEDHEKPVSNVVFYDEPDLIRWFWDMYVKAAGKSVGYNIIGFDLPFLLRRSFDLGIRPGTKVDLRRYQTDPTTDLMALLYNWGQAKGLKWVCERYGIKNPNPNLEGSMVAEMDDATLAFYAIGDVEMVIDLYKKMEGVYFPPFWLKLEG